MGAVTKKGTKAPRKDAGPDNVRDYPEWKLEVTGVTFKRSRQSPEEHGLLVSGQHEVIIDMLGKAVPPGIWYWTDRHDLHIFYR